MKTPRMTKFATPAPLEVSPGGSAPMRGPLESALEQLKLALLNPMLTELDDPRLADELRWAANEAAALAWVTPFPFLFLPALFEEKVAAAKKRRARPGKTHLPPLPHFLRAEVPRPSTRP